MDKTEIKVRDVLDAVDALKALQELQLAGKLSYALAINLRRVDAVLEPFNSSRLELIKKHGDPAEGDQYQIRVEEMDTFTAELEELLDAPAGIDPYLINPELLERADGIKARWMAQTWWIWQQPEQLPQVPTAAAAPAGNGHRLPPG